MHVIAKMANAPNFTFKFAKSSTLSKKVALCQRANLSKPCHRGVLIFSQKDMLLKKREMFERQTYRLELGL